VTYAFTGSPAPLGVGHALSPEPCLAWVERSDGSAGWLTLNCGFLHQHPDFALARRYDGPMAAIRAFALYRQAWLRCRLTASVRLYSVDAAQRLRELEQAPGIGEGPVTTPTKSNGLDCGLQTAGGIG